MIYLVPQTHPDLDDQIKAWGCYFRSLQAHAERATRKYLTPYQINELYKKAQKPIKIWDGSLSAPMNEKCFVRHPEKIIQQAFLELGFPYLGALQIGTNKNTGANKSPTFWDSVIKKKDYHYDFQIQWWSDGLKYSHATLADDRGAVVFNPDPSLELKGMATVELWQRSE